MSGKYKRMDACTPRPKYGGGTWWHRVGSAIVAEDGKITVFLESVPLPDKETGNVKIMLFEPREQQQGEERQQSTARRTSDRRSDVDDEIPF